MSPQPVTRRARASRIVAAAWIAAGAWLANAAESRSPAPTEPTPVTRALMAHWGFDEPGGAVWRDRSGHGHDAVADAGRGEWAQVPGVVGGALRLAGQHRLAVARSADLWPTQQFAASAWARPAAFDPYNEIFRKEDGDRRVLFSFQERGTILALGLNIDGYVECDARIDPEDLLDGQWHHCAATFDGKRMRVFLDGREIGSLPRRGVIAAGGPAPGCVGSLDGSECFQGALDDVRLYSEALTPAEVAALYQSAQPALAQSRRALEERIAALLVPGSSFAETVSRTRERLAGESRALDREVGAAVLGGIKARHPQEFAEFARCTGVRPFDLLLASDSAFLRREASRLMELLVEYRPLTEQQWRRQAPEDLPKWQAIATLERRLEALQAQGEAARYSPAWIEIMVDAGRRVQLRPAVQEAVAPYVRPATPVTRTLSAGEARARLEADWLHQADQNPTPERIRSEIGWTRQLADRIQAAAPADRTVTAALAALPRLSGEAASLAGPDPAFYFRVRELKRRIMFRNPAVDFERVVFVDMPFPQGSEWPHETRHRLGYMAVPGARLLVLEGLAPDGAVRQLMPQPPLHGAFWRPDVSWDGERVIFCYKPHNEKSFHLYEIHADGSGLRQLTDGPYDDLDPIYLPDEQHVVFSTTRGHTYVRCMPPTSAFVLARCDRDGKNLFLLSANNEPDYLPSVLADGRLVYTRWEYTDKPLWRAQKLWTVHPDGTQVNTLWGNQSVWPDLLKDARGIPGSRRVMFTGSAHHDWFAGSIGIVDPGAGLNFPDGLTKVTADVPWPECGNGPVDPVESARYHRSGIYPAYYSPYPLSEQDFLVSARRGATFALYLMDVEGNRELIYEGAHQILHALPLKPRPRPPVIVDTVAWPVAATGSPPRPGVFYSRNVYDGAPEPLRGKARFLRILSIDHKTYTYWHQRPYISTGPVVSGVQSDGVKRILGTVPIEADGSVSFEAPAGVPLHFQLLDGDQRALQTMRSFANLMPGEQRGCLGCHERHSRAPAVATRYQAPPQSRAITPPPWNDTTVSYARYVRPVLDRYCAECHSGAGEGRATLDLSPRPGFLGFDDTYWTLIGRPSWGEPYRPPEPRPAGWGIADMLMVEAFSTTDPAAYQTPGPMTALSYRSRLIDRASSGQHHQVKVDPLSLLRLIVWVDTMCPYRGDEEVREIPDPEFQGVDWLAVRPRIRTAPTVNRPGPVN